MIFGIVEGITEWLSVSSTGHMILLDEFVKLQGSDSFVNVFLVVIQLGALLAVVVLFWDQLFPFQFRDRRKPVLDRGKMAMWGGKIIIACIPAAVEGVLFDSTFEALFYHAVPVALALIVFEIAFIVIESRTEGRQPRITFSNLLMILVSIIVFLALGYLWLVTAGRSYLQRHVIPYLWIFGICLVLSVLLINTCCSGWITRLILPPMTEIRKGMQKIRKGNMEGEIPVLRRDE